MISPERQLCLSLFFFFFFFFFFCLKVLLVLAMCFKRFCLFRNTSTDIVAVLARIKRWERRVKSTRSGTTMSVRAFVRTEKPYSVHIPQDSVNISASKLILLFLARIRRFFHRNVLIWGSGWVYWQLINGLIFIDWCPAGTWRLYNVGLTSIQRHDVASTLRRLCFNVMCCWMTFG